MTNIETALRHGVEAQRIISERLLEIARETAEDNEKREKLLQDFGHPSASDPDQTKRDSKLETHIRPICDDMDPRLVAHLEGLQTHINNRTKDLLEIQGLIEQLQTVHAAVLKLLITSQENSRLQLLLQMPKSTNEEFF